MTSNGSSPTLFDDPPAASSEKPKEGRWLYAICYNPRRSQPEIQRVELVPGQSMSEYLDNLQREENQKKEERRLVLEGHFVMPHDSDDPTHIDTVKRAMIMAFNMGRNFQASLDGKWDEEDK